MDVTEKLPQSVDLALQSLVFLTQCQQTRYLWISIIFARLAFLCTSITGRPHAIALDTTRSAGLNKRHRMVLSYLGFFDLASQTRSSDLVPFGLAR
jgi:hypothetical protein